jgi:hypothetical protein
MLAVRPGSDADPADIVADEDERLSIAYAQYLNSVDEQTRGKFFGLRKEEQLERIAAFIAGEGDV